MTTPEPRRTSPEYVRYVRGHKDAASRAAKAAYMRALRARARQAMEAARARGERHIVEGIKHGYSGYANYYCRCDVCSAAKSEQDARQDSRRAAA